MTVEEFGRNLSAAFTTPLPPAQRSLIERMVEKAIPDHGIRHFLDYTLRQCDRRPNAAVVQELLAEYTRGASGDPEPLAEAGGEACPYGECDGSKMIGGILVDGHFRRLSQYERMETTYPTATALCRCHPANR